MRLIPFAVLVGALLLPTVSFAADATSDDTDSLEDRVAWRNEQADFLKRHPEDALDAAIAKWGAKDWRTYAIGSQWAFNLMELARYDLAETAYRRVIAMDKARGRETYGYVKGNLGRILTRLGRYGEAIAILEPVVAAYKPGSWGLTPILEQLAAAQTLDGRNEEADATWARALALAGGIESDNDQVLFLRNQMAHYYGRAGRFADALPHAERVLAADLAGGSVGGGFDLDLNRAKYRFNLAVPLMGLGRAREAVPLLEAAVAPARKSLDANDPDLALLLLTLARAHVLTGDPAALEEAREAVGIVRKARDARLRGEAAGKTADAGSLAMARAVAGDATLRDPLAGAYASLIAADWGAARRTPLQERQLLDEAFVAAQDLSRSAAGEAMGESAARAVAGTGPLGTLVERKQAIARELRALMREAAGRRAEGGSEDRPKSLAAELAGIDARIEREFPDYGQLVAPGSLTIATVQERLAADEALLLIVPVGDDVFSFAIGKTSARWDRRVGGSAETRKRVERLRCRLDEAACGSPPDIDPRADDPAPLTGIDSFYPRYDRGAAYALYRDLIAPVSEGMTAKRLFATIEGPLSGLPLAALVAAPPVGDAEAAGETDLQGTHWFGEDFAIVSLPVVSALRPAGTRAAAAGVGFVGYGDPLLEGAPAVSRGVGGRSRFRSAVAGLKSVDPASLKQLAPLPGTRIELQAMATTLGSDAKSIHLGGAATEALVREDPALSNARVIAFATHGILPREISGLGEPGLVFTPPPKASARDDGLLTASEAAQLRLKSDWLILSACNTASADGTPGAGSLSSLSLAFLYAGARGLLASHWRVSDDVTAALTVETLRAAKTLSRPEALREAMRAIREGKRADGTAVDGWAPHWRHPAAWAPFTLIAATGD